MDTSVITNFEQAYDFIFEPFYENKFYNFAPNLNNLGASYADAARRWKYGKILRFRTK